MSDPETTARLRERIASARMLVQAHLEAERWDDVAEVARALARMERELALQGAPEPRGQPAGRHFVRG